MPKTEMTDETLAAPKGSLSGLNVVELGGMVAAPFCTKLLADLGANVIKLETPGGGDPARSRGPFPDDVPNRERSALFLYLNTSKRSVTLDLGTPAGQRFFEELVADADILVEDRAPGELEALGLGYAELAARNPRLIMTSITPYGQTGPNRDRRAHHLNLYHAAGHTSPFARSETTDGRAPSRAGGYLGDYDAGLSAALGTLAAVCGREVSGRGQHIDASKQEAMMSLERVTIGRFANEPDPFSGPGRPGGLTKAKDGWVMLTALEAHQWEGLVRAMGNPEWTKAEWCDSWLDRMEHAEEINAHINAWAAGLTRDEIYHRAQAEGTPAAPVRDVAEVLEWEQARMRGFFRELDHSEAGRLSYPTAPYRCSRTSWVGSAAPLLGQHNKEVLQPLIDRAEAPATQERAAPAPSAAEGGGPLKGLRIADFTWAWAGPQASLLLGMLGAEIIKIESRARLDHTRVHSLTAGGIKGGIDGSPVFNDLNLGKRSLTLDLRKEEARDLVRKLVAKSDVVLQNMRPGVLDRMGLGYADLCKAKPDIIMLSSSAVGASGPESTYVGYAPTFACLSGIASISGHPNEPPVALSGSVDLRVGMASAFATLAALVHRQRTGEGQNVDLSSTEVITMMMGEATVGFQLSGRIPERIGNRDEFMAPHGCYRCGVEGEWITIAVGSDEEWQALRSVIGDPELDAADFASAEARHQNQDRLDPIVERWSLRQAPEEAVEALQRAGTPAGRVQNGASLSVDPHLRERDAFDSVDHPVLGKTKVLRPPWRMQGAVTPGPGPLLGQHNDYVLTEILDLEPDEIERLVEAEVVH
jgi:crotonobetainyl-CoA:carnitine CoA-transferase CaiB-like acyl-CoA transferase